MSGLPDKLIIKTCNFELLVAGVLILGQQARNGNIVPRGRAPGAAPLSRCRGNWHGEHVWHSLRSRDRGDAHGAVVLVWRRVREGRGLERGIVHDAAIGRGVGSRRADRVGARAPNLLELSGSDIGTIVSGNGSPELLAASLVDGTKAVSVDDLGLMSHLGVDAESIVGLGRVSGGKRAWLGEENLVLITAR